MINQENFENIEDAEIINDDFSPLDAPVKQRSYTQHKLGDLEEMGEILTKLIYDLTGANVEMIQTFDR